MFLIKNDIKILASAEDIFKEAGLALMQSPLRGAFCNKYKGTKYTYSRFDRIYPDNYIGSNKPELVIAENSHSGFKFFVHIYERAGTPCVSVRGNSNIHALVKNALEKAILIVADGAAFGSEMEFLSFNKSKKVSIYLSESFKWLVLGSGIITSHQISEILQSPSLHIESEKLCVRERFFMHLLTEATNGTYLAYNKHSWNPAYLQENEQNLIPKAMTQE